MDLRRRVEGGPIDAVGEPAALGGLDEDVLVVAVVPLHVDQVGLAKLEAEVRGERRQPVHPGPEGEAGEVERRRLADEQQPPAPLDELLDPSDFLVGVARAGIDHDEGVGSGQRPVEVVGPLEQVDLVARRRDARQQRLHLRLAQAVPVGDVHEDDPGVVALGDRHLALGGCPLGELRLRVVARVDRAVPPVEQRRTDC